MPYSLLGATTIGFDLARLAGGPQVAAVLRGGLAAGPAELAALAAHHPGDDVRREWRQACTAATEAAEDDIETADGAEGRTGDLSRLLPRIGEAFEEAARGQATLLRRLETGTLGDAWALERFLRQQVLEWTWARSGSMGVQDPEASRAADVLADAAVALFLRGRLPAEVQRAMVWPYLAAQLPAPVAAGGTGLPDVDALLPVLAGLDEPQRRAWRRVVDEHRHRTAEWAPAMHQATWAISLADRVRDGCGAQLAAVVAFRDAGFTDRDAAYGVWNAVSGVVQATAVADLLATADADVLLRPWRAVHGEG